MLFAVLKFGELNPPTIDKPKGKETGKKVSDINFIS